MLSENDNKHKHIDDYRIHDRNELYFSSIDIVVTGICLLGDKLFHSTFLIYFLVTYFSIRLFYSTIARNFALLMLLIPNLGVMFIHVAGLSVPILNIFICLALLKLVFSFIHEPIKKTYIFIIGFFIVYEWIHAIYYNFKSLLLLFSWSSAILYVSLFLLHSKKTYNHQVVVKHFLAGVFISTMYGILDFFDRYGSLLNNNATIRFQGGAGDSNYYSMYIMIAMFGMLYVVNRETKKITKIVYPILFVFFIAFGILSLSRMFLLVVTLMCFLLLIKVLLSVKRSKKLFTFILVVVSFLTFFTFYFSEEISSIIELLFSRFTDFIDDPAALTSNRNIIAEQYIQLITSSPIQMIFGIGIQDYHLRSGVYLETHNILLELFVVWGVAGFVVFFVFLTAIFRNIESPRTLSNTNFIGWLPIVCMGISYMSINAMSNESFFLLLLFAIKNIYEFD
ncbi:O-antigen ligase family protein [Psychrobacillus sp. NPDC096389]|uniref:O-antigen ligase family protein n=1 Tax=Psychrobacillus sp. NPDC096389 TaxID=3364490 RepID=UPI003816701E